MKFQKFLKYILPIVAVLCIGVYIGVIIGLPIGKEQGEKNAGEVVFEQGQDAPESTPVLSVTPGADDVPTKAPSADVTQQPEDTPTKAPETDATQYPEDTPTKVPEADATQQPDDKPTKAPSADATPQPTATATPKATAKPTATPKVTATPKPTDIPVAEGEKGYFGRLHVEGTYLANEDKELVQLRGVSTHGLGWFPQYVNEAAIRQFNEEWGCNVFRLAMYTAEGAGYCTGGDDQKKKLKDLVHKGVQAAIEEDMYVIIDWHILQDNDPNLYKDEAKKFFEEMAKTYKDDPHVIYEICNEPNGGTNWSMIKKYALEVIPVIRKYAPNAIIIVGTPTWSQDVDIAAKDPITEYDNIMYALHFYAETHQDSLRNKCKTAVSMGLPIFVTEYGICDASGNGVINEKQANIWIEMLDSYGISHVMWNLANKNESSSMIAAGNSKVNGFTEKDLSESGKWFVNMLQKAGVGVGSALSGTTEAGKGDGTVGSGGAEGGSGGQSQPSISLEEVEKILIAGDGVTYFISNSWNTGSSVGVQLSLTIKNDSGSAVAGWERTLTIAEGVTVEVDQFWSCSVSVKNNVITVTPADYNKNIAAGGSVRDVGIIVLISK